MTNEQSVEQSCLMVLVATALTMVTLDWFMAIPFGTLLSVAVLFPKARTDWLFWTITTGFCLAYLVSRGIPAENIFFLFVYMSLSVLIAAFASDSHRVLGRNSRLIIGFVFLFAALWKIISPDFLSGAFMTFFLLADDRLGPAGIMFTSLTYQDVVTNRSVLPLAPDTTATFISAPEIGFVAQVLTWTTFALESMVALVFLVPLQFFVRLRDYVLLLFLLTAYLFVPVPVFAMSFAALGFSQSTSERMKTIYRVIFVLMPLSAARYYVYTWQ